MPLPARSTKTVVRARPAALALLSVAIICSCRSISRGPAPVGVDPGAAAREVPGVKAAGAATLGALAVHLWQLENGLRVITVPDRTARAVSVVTTFRVGSRDEDVSAGEAGLAHLFEHLMFTGVAAPGQSDFDQQIEEVGGTSNAETGADVTSYTNDVPPEALERVIGLEAARMRGLELDDARVANERRVVIEERLMEVEDSVDGTLEELVWRQAFRTHPYQRSIIGTVDDIKAITRDRAQDFYRRHYAPDRAVLAVAGRFDESTALALIVRGYGSLAGNAAPPGTRPAPERGPQGEVRATIARPVPADRMLIGLPAPELASADRAAYEVLAEALVGSPASRLARQLIVERGVASSVMGEIAPTQDPGLWLIWVQLQKGHAAREAEDAVVSQLGRLAATPLTDGELTGAARRLETAFWSELGASHGRAEELARFEAITGDCRNLMARGAAYQQVTAEDVQRVARTYFGDGARAVAVASNSGGDPS